MEKNIFKNAKFGDKFITKDNHLVMYRDILNDSIQCIIESNQYRKFTIDISYTKDGRAVYENRFIPEWDIVSRYQEPIDEEELDELVHKHIDEWEDTLPKTTMAWADGFKVGYRKAKEG